MGLLGDVPKWLKGPDSKLLEIYFRFCSRKFSNPLYFKHLDGFTKVHISVCSILLFYPAPDLVFWEILR